MDTLVEEDRGGKTDDNTGDNLALLLEDSTLLDLGTALAIGGTVDYALNTTVGMNFE